LERFLSVPEKHLQQLTQLTEKAAQHLTQLAQEWEEYRQPLIAQYRRKKQLFGDRKEEAATKIELIQRMKDDQKAISQNVREKDELHKTVSDELKQLPKTHNRQVYVRRIMDIVKNLEKQKVDIRKVLEDVHRVQKDINTVGETSKRTFAIADEVIFKAASDKKDLFAVNVYRHVVQLRQNFEKLVGTVEDTGRVKNETVDISSRIESIERLNSGLNFERINEDLTQVRNENKALSAKVKAARESALAAGGEAADVAASSSARGDAASTD